MDSADAKDLAEQPTATRSRIEELHNLFGSYKAEWLQERIFEFYTAPDYLPELTTSRPCVLIGGRGTGKTTVLRGMSYQGQAAFRGSTANDLAAYPYFGLYYKVDSNKVAAFAGPELDASGWTRVFGHYLNLVLSSIALRFVSWLDEAMGQTFLSAGDCHAIGTALHIANSQSTAALLEAVRMSQIAFEAYINNVADAPRPMLSLQGAPLELLFGALTSKPGLKGKQFFFLLDEYENFVDYQQQIVNTLIKHCGEAYTFKVGAKDLGWRNRTTLIGERLQSPADYARIDITDRLKGGIFENFAVQVCQARLSKLTGTPIADLRSLLPSLSEDEEAQKLGISDKLDELKKECAFEALRSEHKTWFSDRRPLEQYLALSLALSSPESLGKVIEGAVERPREWFDRVNNYGHALLFSIRAKKRGIRKYYAGWQVFTQLSGSNIRYLLQLVDQSLIFHLMGEQETLAPIPPEIQTLAAQEVGKKNLLELDGLAVEGSELKRLLLGLGRIFEVMAAEPLGHAPEVNQFHLADAAGSGSGAAKSLLESAVMHLALTRTPGNKLGDAAQTKDFDYAIHPIFAAFFVYSYRRKRKMILDDRTILGLVADQKTFIREVLRGNNRREDVSLPEQAGLFAAYYG